MQPHEEVSKMWNRLPPQRFTGRGPGWPGVVHSLFMIALFVALVVVVIWLISNMRKDRVVAAPAAGAHPQDPALYETRLRYARGEISRDDFLRITADLGGGAPLPPAWTPPPASTQPVAPTAPTPPAEDTGRPQPGFDEK